MQHLINNSINAKHIDHEMNIANLEEASDKIDEYELRKRSRHVQKYKEKAWAKWISEYLKALSE